jgi:hypothetical protein
MTMTHKPLTQALTSPSIFSLDTNATFQYFRTFRAKSQCTAEEKLMFAVLNDALECLEKYHNSKRRRDGMLYREAKYWVWGTDDDNIFSFENICETLQINANYLRLGLIRWLEDPAPQSRHLKVWRQPLRDRRRIGVCR